MKFSLSEYPISSFAFYTPLSDSINYSKEGDLVIKNYYLNGYREWQVEEVRLPSSEIQIFHLSDTITLYLFKKTLYIEYKELVRPIISAVKLQELDNGLSLDKCKKILEVPEVNVKLGLYNTKTMIYQLGSLMYVGKPNAILYYLVQKYGKRPITKPFFSFSKGL